jgi:Fe-Mn family superoxide dismutase
VSGIFFAPLQMCACRILFLIITCRFSTQNNLGLPFQRYVATAKMLIESGGALLKNLSQEQIIVAVSSGAELHSDNVGLFNNVAQSWNHNFYWHSMKPGGGGEPHGMLAEKIKEDFGSYDKLMGEMEKVAMTAFGSGWAWLGYHKMNGKLIVTKTTGEV